MAKSLSLQTREIVTGTAGAKVEAKVEAMAKVEAEPAKQEVKEEERLLRGATEVWSLTLCGQSVSQSIYYIESSQAKLPTFRPISGV